MKKIYVVMGRSIPEDSESSGYDWPVIGFANKKKADRRVSDCEKESQRISNALSDSHVQYRKFMDTVRIERDASGHIVYSIDRPVIVEETDKWIARDKEAESSAVFDVQGYHDTTPNTYSVAEIEFDEEEYQELAGDEGEVRDLPVRV